MDLTEFENNVVLQWAEKRRKFEEAAKHTQLDKTREEVNELEESIFNNDKNTAKDAIGDIIVTLVIQAKMWDLSLMECCEAAWNEIKD